MELVKIKGLPFYRACTVCDTVYPFGDATLSTAAIGGYMDKQGQCYCNLCAHGEFTWGQLHD